MKNSASAVLVLLGIVLLAACASSSRHTGSATLATGFTPVPPAAVDVLTQHNNAERTGADLVEERLTPTSLRNGSFQRLFDWRVDGQIYGQPLYVSGVSVGSRQINMVIVATMNNSVYAFEAPPADSDHQPAAGPLWQVGQKVLGAPLPYDFFPMLDGFLGHNIKPLIGIVATPVIDLQRSLVYVTAKSGSCLFLNFFCRARYRLVAIDLASGQIVQKLDIKATYTSASGQVTAFNAKYQMQRAGLLEDPGQTGEPGRLYLAFASHQDSQPYHGWVLVYQGGREQLTLLKAYCTTCERPEDQKCEDQGSCEGGIWQAGSGPASDGRGHLYVMSGNGSSSNQAGDLANGFLKLDTNALPVGSWLPPNYACLNTTDSDLGSAGPLYFAEQDMIIGGGKEGLLYAIPAGTLQGRQIGAGTPGELGGAKDEVCPYKPDGADQQSGVSTIQEAPLWEDSFFMDILKLIGKGGLAQGYHHIHGTPVLWKVHDPAHGDRWFVYVSAERDLLRAYEFNHGFVTGSPPGSQPVASFTSRCKNSSKGMPGGFLTLSAQGSEADSGIVWASMPRRDEDALQHTVHGVLRAYAAYPDAEGKLVELWNSDEGAHPRSEADCDFDPDFADHELGFFAKYVAPTVADGKVYMATFSHRLVVYGLTTVTAPTANFGATLAALPALPDTVEPGSTIPITVVATNTGTSPWQASDGYQLDSQSIPDFDQSVVGGQKILRLPQDVPPGQSYTFNFKLHVPSAEGPYRYDWRIKHTDVGTHQVSGDWVGQPSPPWRFAALRAACADIRSRGATLSHQVAAEVASRPSGTVPSVSDSTTAQVRDLEAQAKKRHCAILSDYMDMRSTTP